MIILTLLPQFSRTMGFKICQEFFLLASLAKYNILSNLFKQYLKIKHITQCLNLFQDILINILISNLIYDLSYILETFLPWYGDFWIRVLAKRGGNLLFFPIILRILDKKGTLDIDIKRFQLRSHTKFLPTFFSFFCGLKSKNVWKNGDLNPRSPFLSYIPKLPEVEKSCWNSYSDQFICDAILYN